MNPEWKNNELDVFAQLKPLYGEAIDRYYIAYVAARTPQQKAKILQFLQLLSIRVQKKRIGNKKIYLEPPRQDVIGSGDYTIGNVLFPGNTPYPFTLYRKELLRHVLMNGPSGSGKTTLVLNIMQQLQADDIPWLALDWKRSFRVLMHDDNGKDVLVLTVGNDVAPLRINMLLPPPGVSTTAWVDNLTDTICAGYLLLDGAQSALKAVFYDAITAYGKHATLRDALSLLRQRFSEVPTWRKRQLGWMESTERALVQLTTGPFGDCLSDSHPMLVGELLQRKVAIELEGLGQAQGSTLCIFFLQCTLLTRQKQHGPREVLRHVTIIDEAQNIFRRESNWEKLSLPSRTIREVREYGECVIAATQQTDVSDSLLANTGTKFLMRTNAKWDLDYYSKSFQIDPTNITTIPNGQGITIIPSRYYKPFLFSFKENKLKNTIVTDEEVTARYETWREGKTTKATSAPPSDAIIGPKELALLRDIATNPLATITQHYTGLGWNPKTGTTVRDYLVRHQLITMEVLQRGRATMKYAKLTKDGLLITTAHGIKRESAGPGGVEHEYWRQELRTILEAHKYTVTAEYDLGGRYADLHATRGTTTLLLEIETGKSDIQTNLAKCAGKGTLIMFFTSSTALAQAQPLPKTLITITPETISTLDLLLD